MLATVSVQGELWYQTTCSDGKPHNRKPPKRMMQTPTLSSFSNPPSPQPTQEKQGYMTDILPRWPQKYSA